MNTMIISAFPGCGKTYLTRNQENLDFSFMGEDVNFTFCDLDSSQYEKTEGWTRRYIDHVIAKVGTVDFIFVSAHDSAREELARRELPYVTVMPDCSEWMSEKEHQLIKQQWFGRFILRDNSHIKDVPKWLHSMYDNWDSWTSRESVYAYNPAAAFLLEADQYIPDVIIYLYWRKESYPAIYCLKAKDIV